MVKINQKIWAKHSQHNRIVKCKIEKIDKTPLCLVQFSDGSISDSITLAEIKVLFLLDFLYYYLNLQVKHFILNHKFTFRCQKYEFLYFAIKTRDLSCIFLDGIINCLTYQLKPEID